MASTLTKVHTSQFNGDEVQLVFTTNEYSELQWLVNEYSHLAYLLGDVTV